MAKILAFSLAFNSLLTSDSCYEIYKQCMFEPTKEKYLQKINEIISEENNAVYLCAQNDDIIGIIAISKKTNKTEIIGIAIKQNKQRCGIGRFMIEKIIDIEKPKMLYAQTDNDAFDFYKNCGFEITHHKKKYGNCECVRYDCVLEVSK